MTHTATRSTETHATDLLAAGTGAIGYLLEDRVSDIDSFLDACARVAAGGMVLDPEVVAQVMGRSRTSDPINELTPRERAVLAEMAQGRTNAGIARALFISEGAVEKHSQRIVSKLGLPDHGEVHRRVRAVLTFLQG